MQMEESSSSATQTPMETVLIPEVEAFAYLVVLLFIINQKEFVQVKRNGVAKVVGAG